MYKNPTQQMYSMKLDESLRAVTPDALSKKNLPPASPDKQLTKPIKQLVSP